MKAQLTQEAKDALIKKIRKEFYCFCSTEYDCGCTGRKETLDSAIRVVESFPTSDEGRWIPVTERLPEDCETVIATDGENSVPVTYINKLFYFIGSPAQFYLVTAWQPIPNPPTSHK